MTPWQIAGKSEASQQRALMAWCNQVAKYGIEWADNEKSYALLTRNNCAAIAVLPLPDFARIFAIHNQGHGDRIRGAAAKAEGVKPGVPDLFWPLPVIGCSGLFIEMKTVKGGLLSPDQADWRVYLRDKNYLWQRANGWLEARQIMLEYYGWL